MFTSFPFIHEWKTTKREAINMLINFLETGKVVWRKDNFEEPVEIQINKKPEFYTKL